MLRCANRKEAAVGQITGASLAMLVASVKRNGAFHAITWSNSPQSCKLIWRENLLTCNMVAWCMHSYKLWDASHVSSPGKWSSLLRRKRIPLSRSCFRFTICLLSTRPMAWRTLCQLLRAELFFQLKRIKNSYYFRRNPQRRDRLPRTTWATLAFVISFYEIAQSMKIFDTVFKRYLFTNSSYDTKARNKREMEIHIAFEFKKHILWVLFQQ